MSAVIQAADPGSISQPAIMSSTTGTIAFGTTFLALAAGLAVFAAVRQKDNPIQQFGPFTTTLPATSISTTTELEERAITQVATTVEEEETTTLKTTTPRTTTKKTTRLMSRLPASRRNARKTTTSTTTTIKTPPNDQIEIEENYFDGNQNGKANTFDATGNEVGLLPEDFEIGDAELRQLLINHRKQFMTAATKAMSTTTPRNVYPFSLKTRGFNLPTKERLFAPIAASWPPAGRYPSTATPQPYAPTSRVSRLQTSLLTNVLNDPITIPSSRPSNQIYRRETTPPRYPYFYEQLPQLFAEEAPPGHFIGDHATPSTPFLLTLFTTADDSSNVSVQNNGTTVQESSTVSSLAEENSLRQSHRRSVSQDGKTQHLSSSSIAYSTPATSLLVVIAILLFVAVVLIVAIIIQRRHFLAKLRRNAIGHCSVFPLPIAVPNNNSPATAAIVDLTGPIDCSSSSSASSSSASPAKSKHFQRKSGNVLDSSFFIGSNPNSPSVMPGSMACDDDIINAMTSISSELVDTSNTTALRYSTSSYPMPLHHY